MSEQQKPTITASIGLDTEPLRSDFDRLATLLEKIAGAIREAYPPDKDSDYWRSSARV